MPRKYLQAIVLLAAVATSACGGKRSGQAAPQDPILAVPVAPLPVGSLAGSSALVLVTGAVVFGDSTQGLLPRRTALLEAANAALDTALRRDAREVDWQGLAEQRRALRRNPAMNLDPDRLPTSYVVGAEEQQRLPEPLWSGMRTLAALTNARYALIPALVRIDGTLGAPRATFVLLAADARTGLVVWRGRVEGRAAATPEAALAAAAAALVPSPVP